MEGQAAIDYFSIISIAFMILIPLSIYVNQLLNNFRDDTRISLARDAVKRLGENADWVYSQGPPAKRSLRIRIPDGIEEVSLDNRTILFKVRTSAGVSDVYYETIPSLNGSLPDKEGDYIVSLTAFEDYVNISVVE